MSNKKTKKSLPKPLPPEESNRYVVGQYNPESGARYHICAFTGYGFFGRKNQVYLDATAKSAAATQKRALKRKRPPEVERAIQTNDQILEKFYIQGKKTLEHAKFIFSDFSFAVKRKMYYNDHKIAITFYDRYGIYHDKNTDMIRIFRKGFDHKIYQSFDGKVSRYPEDLQQRMTSFGMSTYP